jgi:hypothetical protein
VSELRSSGKPFEISKREVWEAYERVKANKGAPGVDGCSIEEFEADLKNNLYKIWIGCRRGATFLLRCGWWRYRNRTAAGPGCSACRRRRHSAASSSNDLGFVLVTHPFHALSASDWRFCSSSAGAGTRCSCAVVVSVAR